MHPVVVARTSKEGEVLDLRIGPEIIKTSSATLERPMLGETVLPTQTSIELEPTNMTSGIQVVQLADGRFFAATAEAIKGTEGQRLGRLVAAYYASDLT